MEHSLRGIGDGVVNLYMPDRAHLVRLSVGVDSSFIRELLDDVDTLSQ